MPIESNTLSLSPALYRQFLRLKALSCFQDDQDLMQAAFQALEREWRHGTFEGAVASRRYMPHPGLGPDDYDT